MNKFVKFIKFNLFFDFLVFLLILSCCIICYLDFPIRVFLGISIIVLANSIVLSVID